MHILSTLCGLLAGLILGALTAFFQLFGLAALELGAQRLLNSPLSPKQDLFLNLAVYAVLLYFVFFRALFGRDEPTPTQLFYRTFIVALPLPGIWLMYAWPAYGG
ncbi:MAG: hypothetical protein E6614_36735 [Bradyrhizobium sp.]|uniref:Uncharacterized protein n=1 Tax=Bradyrhizobium denitrificans TaxID=2734912 RepID=A0ABS5G1S6_9BRAD|nr:MULTISPECIES: hypothetical protein [Bradyrhizobium]MBR1135175.1 hypothetical protein [Bradyrhizobium denitrificans]MDU0956097.1 hypothetical protein [Bradyrhizobium sp.]MDU1494061.1 hypothetical protein [Bradyrhizobium sp.]MDU1544219.1 hypothetical protein [Bradyrhizobium sp.]MDU1669162.1 hypothetical protein [Bradyrhizobium sp.]